MRIPTGLDWWRGQPGGAEWLDRLPAIVAECADRWSIALEPPFEPASVSLVVPAGDVVLKVNFPDEESEHEADALAHFGDGAVELVAQAPDLRALLVERCRPGTTLWQVADETEAIGIAATVLAGIWRPPRSDHAFRLLEAEALTWIDELPRDWEALGRPFERTLLDEAVAAMCDLGPTQGDPVVLHQDFHGGNVLRAERRAWLAIDPKPLVGEREFDAASLLRDRRWELARPGAAERIRRRLDFLSAEIGLDRERMRLWGIAHALAWGISATKLEADMIECARLLSAA